LTCRIELAAVGLADCVVFVDLHEWFSFAEDTSQAKPRPNT
jgi:hypothetical protein